MKSLKYITILVPLAVTTIAGCNELQKDPSADIKTFDLKTNKRAESGFGIYADEIASENFRIRKVNGLSNYDLLENELKD